MMSHYGPIILSTLGFSEKTSLLLNGFTGLVKVCFGAVALFFLLDTLGRRKLILAGSITIVITQFYVGTYTLLTHPTNQRPSAWSYSALVALYLYAGAFAASWNYYPYILTAEMFPTRLRAFAVAVISIVQLAIHLAFAWLVPVMIARLKFASFYFWGGLTAVNTVLFFVFFPETKGFPLEKIELLFEGSLWARKARRDAEKRLDEEKGCAD